MGGSVLAIVWVQVPSCHSKSQGSTYPSVALEVRPAP